MKIILAPDSFKGSLSAPEICDAMEQGIRAVLPDVLVVKVPMADGGEGTVQALVSSTGGRLLSKRVVGPLGESVDAQYGILGDSRTAVIEMAAASGLPLVPLDQRNPLKTTTYGTGQLILAALEKGCRQIIIGIGGSATSDCGTGMAQALGVMFFRSDDSEILEHMCGELMAEVARIDLQGRHPLLAQSRITAACDVDNPLLGPRGAVMVYSRQKGASDTQLQILERNMQSIIGVTEMTIKRSIRNIAGAGAAGGLGAGLIAFTGADLQPGVQLVLEACRFAEKICSADLILTGEGNVDFQTIFGKTISGVAGEAKKQNIPVVVIAGGVEERAENLYDAGVTAMFSICNKPMPLNEAVAQTAHLVQKSTERIMRLVKTVITMQVGKS
jgi:glycerate 2-kinase